jgi:hypothetical protein
MKAEQIIEPSEIHAGVHSTRLSFCKTNKAARDLSTAGRDLIEFATKTVGKECICFGKQDFPIWSYMYIYNHTQCIDF